MTNDHPSPFALRPLPLHPLRFALRPSRFTGWPFAPRALRTRSLPLPVLTLIFALTAGPFSSVFAQSASATLSGTCLDENGAAVPGSQITVLNQATSLRRETTTNESGNFAIPLLPPGSYILSATHDGFKVVEVRDIVLNVGDERSLRIQMKVGDVKEVVNVTGESPLINESPAVGTVVDRKVIENMPLNGRSFQTLFMLTPGVVLTVANLNNLGQFSVNGQRSDANYFTVDGVSANAGSTPGLSNATAGGAIPAFGVTGGTNTLVSVDATGRSGISTQAKSELGYNSARRFWRLL